MAGALRVGVGVADLRSEPKFRSERVDQAIWGEEVKLLGEEQDGYVKIRAPDGYEAFIMANCLKKRSKPIEFKIVETFIHGDLRLPVGSLLTSGDVEELGIRQRYRRGLGYRVDMVAFGQRYLGVPYLWGGGTEFGTDCSGFTQRVYGFNNIALPRNADDQERAGEVVESLNDAAPADLVFFPGHVGMYMGKGKIIHSNLHAQRVSITDLNSKSEYAKRLKEAITSIRTYKRTLR